VQAIKYIFKKRDIRGLLSERDGRLVGESKQVEGVEDFELITWFVIKGE
jgi:hypothetical protein